MPTGAEFGTALGGMSTGPSSNFLSRLGQMAPGILSGMSNRYGDPQMSSPQPLGMRVGQQRPRNMGGMRPPVQGPQLVQPPTNIPNITPGAMNPGSMNPGMNIAPGLTEMPGPRMPQSTSGPITAPGLTEFNPSNRFSMPSNNSGFTGGMGGGNLWDIYNQILNQGNTMGMM